MDIYQAFEIVLRLARSAVPADELPEHRERLLRAIEMVQSDADMR